MRHDYFNRPTPAFSQRLGRLLALTFVVAGFLGAGAQPAAAATYTVTGSCSWTPSSSSAAIRVYHSSDGACPALSMAAEGAGTAGAVGGWTFNAPAGTSIAAASFQAWAAASHGWQAAVYRSGGGASGTSLLNCPGGEGCSANPGNNTISGPAHNASAIVAHLRCSFASSCPAGSALQIGGDVTVTVQDDVPPSVSADGPGASPGWKRGSPQIVINASDNTGIQQTRLLVNGHQKFAIPHGCSYAAAVPCANASDAVTVPLAGMPDGKHNVTVQAIDAAGNVGGADRMALVDNTPPASMLNAIAADGAGWRASSSRRIMWANPPQRFAPIAGVSYSLCPVDADSADPAVAARGRKACVQRTLNKAGATELPALELPKPGLWVLRAWLVDAAGNADPESAVKIADLGYDPTPPSVAGFAASDPNDPARVTVRAGDDVSGLAGGTIEARRRGTRAWRPLRTEARDGAITAAVDDETLRKGRYALRATVVNAAGLQQGTNRAIDGKPMTLKLPIRMASRLRAGRLAGKTCQGRGAKRRCRQKLRGRVPVALGRRITLRGRLTVRGKPVKRQPLEVWQRVSLAGAGWQRIGSAQTNARGRFRYKTAKGPARALRFRYPGTPHIRGDNRTIRLQVQAATSIRPSRRHLINGEYVTFTGQLKGAWRPPAGVLVELQVFARGHWRTFAQPRADAATGTWSYQHRFETVRAGDARFRFRARIRRQAGYPLATGHSRTLKITVSGL